MVLLPMSSPFSRGLHFCRMRRTSYTMDGFCLLYLLMILLMRSGDVETNPGPNTSESTVSEMEILKLAQDIPPSYYNVVGSSLGIPYAQLQSILSEELNYTHAFLHIFMKWNAMEQPPHWNKRQLLADKLREINLGGLSDILNGPQIPNITELTEASLGNTISTSPRQSPSTLVDTPPQGASAAVSEVSTSTAREVSNAMLNKLARQIPSDHYDTFSEKLGIKRNEARNIVAKYQSDYEKATRECIAKWRDRSTRSVADLHGVLRAADLGGLIVYSTEDEYKKTLADEIAKRLTVTPPQDQESLEPHSDTTRGRGLKPEEEACNESKVLCDLYFSDLAEQIGAEWQQLGYQLHLSKADIEQIMEDKQIAVDRRVALLQMWKNRSSCTDKRRMVEELCEALSSRSCSRRDLAEIVKKDAGIS